jgi:hypothetical protein
MSDFVQLDLFGDRPNFDRPPNAVSLQPRLPQELSDEELIAAIPRSNACRRLVRLRLKQGSGG